jgi:hypothetical protein
MAAVISDFMVPPRSGSGPAQARGPPRRARDRGARPARAGAGRRRRARGGRSETGALHEIQTSDRRLRARYAAAAAAERAAVAQAIRPPAPPTCACVPTPTGCSIS